MRVLQKMFLDESKRVDLVHSIGVVSYIPVMSHLSGVDAAAFVIPEADRQKVVHVLQASRLHPSDLASDSLERKDESVPQIGIEAWNTAL